MKTTGNAEKQPADPYYYLPPKSPKSFVQDNALYLAVSSVGNVLLVLGILFISLILMIHYKRTPVIITQNEGFCYKRTTDAFHLNELAIKIFLRFTLESLLNPRFIDQDPRIFIPFADANVVQATLEHLQQQRKTDIPLNRRQYWELEEFIENRDARFLTIKKTERIRRYDNPQLPQFIGLAVLGYRAVVEDVPALDDTLSKSTSSSPSLIIVYLAQIRPNAYNPWGLYITGIQEKTDPKDIEQIWQMATPLVASEDLQSHPILTSRKEYLSPPVFETIRFYNWFPWYPQFSESLENSESIESPTFVAPVSGN
ncbi:MAG: hypothetical protein ACOY3I_02635 [Verrucomicrobiota bacterium]